MGEMAQGINIAARPEFAAGQHFRAGGRLSGLADFLGDLRLKPAAFFLHPGGIVVRLRVHLRDDLHDAHEMCLEQRVELREPFHRRRQGGQCSPPDILHGVGAKQLDGL